MSESERERRTGAASAAPVEEAVVVRHEEVAHAIPTTVPAGAIRVRKTVEAHAVSRLVPRHVEEWDSERAPAGDPDTGHVESLPDGSISVPLFGEEIVVEKRLRVKERVVIRKEVRLETRRIDAARDVEQVDAAAFPPGDAGNGGGHDQRPKD